MERNTNINLFKVGDRYELRMKVTVELMAQFSILSGDRNQVHHDAGYALMHGFSGPIVYGNLMGAMVSRLVGMELPCGEVLILRQNLDFRNPAYVDDEILLEAVVTAVIEAVQSVQLKLHFQSNSSGSLCTGMCLFKVF
jgi:acyl dehydratase